MRKSERFGLTTIADQGRAEQAGNAAAAVFGPGHCCPGLKPGIDLIGGQILPDHDPRFVPHARQGIGIGEILAHFGGALPLTDGIGQHDDAALLLPRHDQCQPEIGGRQDIAISIERVERGGIVPERKVAQHQPERRAAAVITQFDCVGIGNPCGFEAARTQIGVTEQETQRRVAAIGLDRLFGERDRARGFPLGHRVARLLRDFVGPRRVIGTSADERGHRRPCGQHGKTPKSGPCLAGCRQRAICVEIGAVGHG